MSARWDWASAFFHREHREHREHRSQLFAAQGIACSRWTQGGVHDVSSGARTARWGLLAEMALSERPRSRFVENREQLRAATANNQPQGAQEVQEIVPDVRGVRGDKTRNGKPDPQDSPNEDAFEEAIAAMVLGGMPPAWAEQAVRICAAPTPASRRDSEWRAELDAALVFADAHAERAHRLAWTFRDLLTGLPSIAALLRQGARVTQVRADAIVLELDGRRRIVSHPKDRGSARGI